MCLHIVKVTLLVLSLMVHLLVSKRVLFLIDPCSIVVNVKMIVLLQVRLVNIENPNSIKV